MELSSNEGDVKRSNKTSCNIDLEKKQMKRMVKSNRMHHKMHENYWWNSFRQQRLPFSKKNDKE